MATKRFIPINLRLPENLIRESDELAEAEGSNRSELVRNALRSYIQRRTKLQNAYKIVEQRGKAARITTQADVDGVLAEIRRERNISK